MTILTYHQLTCHDQSTHPDNRERFTLALSADQTGLETLARTLQATRADEQPVPARHLNRPQYTVTQAELTLQPPELLAERPRWHARIDTTYAQSGPQDTLHLFGDASSLPHAPQHTLTVTLSSLTPDAGRAFRLGQSSFLHAPEKQNTENQTPPAGPA